ncbi:L,D-transpeptidase family protein [Sphingomonas sp. MG17]|uniref:L,D-transpeptidase family protein n=1 Tax=Sphingomonas tagetis TaxID=2949092 RepID=A0A9X2HF92_9SPHN|nr:L,D-transpeptidase family protein [Sphingomonas tagetis]MCP3729788.1 L,D-transpeptidase family protein [Sphingomonas tagetis]
MARRRLGWNLWAAAPAALLMLAPVQVQAQAADPELAAAIADTSMDRELRAFYAARGFRPVWLASGASLAAAERLIEIFEQAELDGLDSGDYRPRRLRDAIEDAREGDAEDAAKAEALISRSYVEYVRDLHGRVRSPMAATDPDFRPEPPSARDILQQMAAAPSLAAFVDGNGWMHPFYAGLRRALIDAPAGSEQARLLRLNLDRARGLPGNGRHVVVDTAGGRLYMFAGGKVVDSMKVIAGRPATPTPMMTSVIRYATLNPYWNVPTDLTRSRLAPEVVEKGPVFLKAGGYDVLSDWSPDAAPTDAALVDWRAVASGARVVRVRQRPGLSNGMGRMKFMFPNGNDIYLHDTPEKGLFSNAGRYFSAGCIRLEDAPRLGRWLFGKPLKAASAKPEQRVELADPVPIYITYFTAFPTGKTVAMRADVYGRDGARQVGMR